MQPVGWRVLMPHVADLAEVAALHEELDKADEKQRVPFRRFEQQRCKRWQALPQLKPPLEILSDTTPRQVGSTRACRRRPAAFQFRHNLIDRGTGCGGLVHSIGGDN